MVGWFSPGCGHPGRGVAGPRRGRMGRTEATHAGTRHRHWRFRDQGRAGGHRAGQIPHRADQAGDPAPGRAGRGGQDGQPVGGRVQLDRAGRDHVPRRGGGRRHADRGQPGSGVAQAGHPGPVRSGHRAEHGADQRRRRGRPGRDVVRRRGRSSGHGADADVRHRDRQRAVPGRRPGAQHRVRPHRDPRPGRRAPGLGTGQGTARPELGEVGRAGGRLPAAHGAADRARLDHHRGRDQPEGGQVPALSDRAAGHRRAGHAAQRRRHRRRGPGGRPRRAG